MSRFEIGERLRPHKRLGLLGAIGGAKIAVMVAEIVIQEDDEKFFSGKNISRRTFLGHLRLYSASILTGSVIGGLSGAVFTESAYQSGQTREGFPEKNSD